MLKRWTWLLLVLVALMAFVGCSDDDPVTPPVGDTAFETLAKVGAAYINGGGCPGTVSAEILNGHLADYTVIDVRQLQDYDAGHIPGAYHSSLATLLTDLKTTIPAGDTYVVVCYSGQSAGHAKIAMELMGYDDTLTLSFGMCSWSPDTDTSWVGNTGANGNQLAVAETTNNNGDLVEHAFPTLAGETAASVVANRVNAMLANNFQGVMYSTVKDVLDDYFVINYFGVADYEGTNVAVSGVPGHIPGSYQFTPAASLGIDQMLHNLPLPEDKKILVYCWTSQTSSQVAAYLNMLGYEAYSLKFGSNNLFYDSLILHKWAGAADYPLEVTP